MTMEPLTSGTALSTGEFTCKIVLTRCKIINRRLWRNMHFKRRVPAIFIPILNVYFCQLICFILSYVVRGVHHLKKSELQTLLQVSSEIAEDFPV